MNYTTFELPKADYRQLADDYRQIEKALIYLEHNFDRQPTLDEIAASAGFSEYHFQRLFTRWVGISPKRFLQYLTKEHAKELLEHSASLLDVSYQSGLSGPGRLHDLFVTCEAVTPGQYKSRGEGMAIRYGFHETPFGECLLAVTDRGICSLSFNKGNLKDAVDDFRHRWEKAQIIEDPNTTASLVQHIFPLANEPSDAQLHLHLSGTNFQIKVWEALLRIPAGNVVSYEQIAEAIGKPTAARAVSRAVAENPVAYIIPCHRVIRKMGVFGGYRWGPARKKAILGWEMVRGAL